MSIHICLLKQRFKGLHEQKEASQKKLLSMARKTPLLESNQIFHQTNEILCGKLKPGEKGKVDGGQ
jgi:hypothetical protein